MLLVSSRSEESVDGRERHVMGYATRLRVGSLLGAVHKFIDCSCCAILSGRPCVLPLEICPRVL